MPCILGPAWSTAFEGEIGILQFASQFIIPPQRLQVLLQSQTKKNIGIGPKRNGGITTFD